MSSGIQYIWEVSICLAGFYLFYRAFLSRDSFYQRNRFFLLCAMCLSLVLPALSITLNVNAPLVVNPLAYYNADISWEPDYPIGDAVTKQASAVSWLTMLLAAYIVGVAISLARVVQNLLRLIKSCSAYEVKSVKGMKLVLTDSTSSPYSFFHYVFLSPKAIGASDTDKILMHEAAHAKQLHSLDLLLVEIIRILLWFNPFIYLYKKAFVEVHEYLADRDCLRNGVCSIDYQNIMLQSVQNRLSNALASGFATSLTLKRIKMMTRIRTSRFAHIKLTLILPVLAILLMSFSFEKAPLDLLSNQPPLTPGNTDPEFVLPVKADKGIYLASGYGNRVHPIERVEKMHNGVDIAGPEGTPILAVADGVISKIVEVKGYGKYLVIDHANGFSSLYAQLSGYAAKQGQTVKRGELIAYMGQSGVSTGPHLHFELRKDGEAIDPSGYLKLNLYSTKK